MMAVDRRDKKFVVADKAFPYPESFFGKLLRKLLRLSFPNRHQLSRSSRGPAQI
jgi:hypothetical protein